jgi:hypothetical protein
MLSLTAYQWFLPAIEDQIEARERRIMEYKQKEYLTQHLILSSTSPHLSKATPEYNCKSNVG